MNLIKSLIFTFLITGLPPLLGQFGEGEHQSGNKHLAAYHYTVVCTGNAMPSTAILTYPVNEFRVQDYNFLLKLMPCLDLGEEIIFPSRFQDTEVEDFPGGVLAKMHYNDTMIRSSVTPLLIGRGDQQWKGAALYEVETNGGNDLLVYLGGGETINLIWGFENSIMKKDSVTALENATRIDSSTLKFISGKENLHVGLRTSGTIEGNVIRFKGGKGHILVVYSEYHEALKALLSLDVSIEKQKVKTYYGELLSSGIHTPEETMNAAFASAIYNLEYSWLEPFGWGECLHHWLALWYMQVTAAADWIGQSDRSRSSILEHGLQSFENGAIPMLNPNHLKLGMKRRDWGGANTFWVWQVRHYLKMTGDREFAGQILPIVERCIRQTLDEYDPDGNLLLAWGLQIGNQEDFVANPYDGSVPTMELYNMFITMAELYEITGNSALAGKWEHKALEIKETLHSELWQEDLGRFAYYRDPTGKVMPDGPYQTYLYPTIYELVDQYDRYSGLRHLMDRLMDEDGAVFVSNNFPFHVPESVSTWGMQRGAAQQPWAAMGFSAMGLNELTWKPLMAMAKWAQDPRREGSWPETGPEPTPAYFTPPAGLYISTVVEALFGLRKDVPGGFMTLSPSFPEHWPEASLNLPGIAVEYSRENSSLKYRIQSDWRLPVKVRWALPVGSIISCLVNNRKADYTIESGIHHMVLCFEVKDARNALIQIDYEALEYRLDSPGSLCEGDYLEVKLEGAAIESLTDRAGILDSVTVMSHGKLTGRVSGDLLEPYLKYGPLGQLNFSRRSLFLNCRTPEGKPFVLPVDISILPRWEATLTGEPAVEGSKILIPFKIRNNRLEPFKGEALIRLSEKAVLLDVEMAGRSEKEFSVSIPSPPGLSQGENQAMIHLPGESPVKLPFRIEKQVVRSRWKVQPLAVESLISDKDWFGLRIMPGYPHIFFTFSPGKIPEPMEALQGITSLKVKQVPGLAFAFRERSFLPVSHLSGKTSCRIELEKGIYKKVYLLLLSFVDNHDMFSEVARITAYGGSSVKFSRSLCYPGDVDYWVSNRNPTSFATLRESRKLPFELLPLMDPAQKDWHEGTPPDFPQSKWWSTSLALPTESCVMSVIEIDPGRAVELDHLVVESIGTMPAMGVVAVTGELYK